MEIQEKMLFLENHARPINDYGKIYKKAIASLDGIDRCITNYGIVYSKAIASLDGMENHCEEMLRRNQNDARKTLEQSQNETAEALIQRYENYYAFSLELQKRTQMTLDKLQKLTPLDVRDIQTISQGLQSTLDAIKAKYWEIKAFEEIESNALKDLQRTTAAELNELHESDAQKRSILHKVDAEQLRLIQENITDSMEKLQKPEE